MFLDNADLEQMARTESYRSERELRKELKHWEKQLQDIEKEIYHCENRGIESSDLIKRWEEQKKDVEKWITVYKKALSYR